MSIASTFEEFSSRPRNDIELQILNDPGVPYHLTLKKLAERNNKTHFNGTKVARKCTDIEIIKILACGGRSFFNGTDIYKYPFIFGLMTGKSFIFKTSPRNYNIYIEHEYVKKFADSFKTVQVNNDELHVYVSGDIIKQTLTDADVLRAVNEFKQIVIPSGMGQRGTVNRFGLIYVYTQMHGDYDLGNDLDLEDITTYFNDKIDGKSATLFFSKIWESSVKLLEEFGRH